MLKNYFNLNGNPKEINEQSDFMDKILDKAEISDIIYWPDYFQPKKKKGKKKRPRIKIESKSFRNVSFTKTTLKNIDFTSCHFEDCLFVGSKIDNCKFRQCSFKNVNTHEIEIIRTYINPKSFVGNIDKNDIEKSNIAVHLFQQLLNNARDEEQSEFARIANYNFKKWQGRLSKSKFYRKKPYPIKRIEFYEEYIPNFIYRWVFGYGLRLRSFVATFLATFVFFFILNLIFWNNYVLCHKDFPIQSFVPEKYDVKANLFFTADVMTQLVDSQFQPSSNFGMAMLSFQGFSGFILLSFLITVLINRFVK